MTQHTKSANTLSYDQTYKSDMGKLKISLVPPSIIPAIAVVRQMALKKYPEKDGWRNVEIERYYDAMYRHMIKIMENTHAVDSESKLPHTWHIATNIAFIIQLEQEKALQK